jgi:DNA repair protein RadC
MVVESPNYPELDTAVNTYIGLIEHWDEKSINSVRQLKTLALDDNNNVICEIYFDVKKDTLFANLEDSFDLAKKNSAKKVILAQNYAFQHSYPDQSDKKLAKKILKFASKSGVTVANQLVVSENAYYSYTENGLSQV